MSAATYKVSASLIAVPIGAQILQYTNGDVLPAGVDSDVLSHLESLGFIEKGVDAKSDDSHKGYDDFKVADLKAEIDKRNEGREEADQISPEGKKDDLVAALEADDNK